MISVAALTKRFGSVNALGGIDLRLRDGVITAVAGPNGSGKTTLIKSILGLVKPDGGRIEIDGVALNGQPDYRRQIGYMPQQGQFPDNLRVREVLNLVKSVREDVSVFDEHLVARLGLESELNKKVGTLSGGTRQKLNAVIAFLFQPQLFILDEPTASLDPTASGILKSEIRNKREAGKSVILTSHIPSEIDELADDVIFLCEGRVVYAGAKEALKEATGEGRIEAAFARLMEDGQA